MDLEIDVELKYECDAPTDVLLQIEVADMPGQPVSGPELTLADVEQFYRVAAEDGIGERIWLQVEGVLDCVYRARVAVDRPQLDISLLPATPSHQLPGETVRYLMPSRYCPSDQFEPFVMAEFGSLQGGATIAAMRDWINERFSYVPGSSTAQTTALESFVQRQGVCRDYAHVLISLARAAAIPARFASVYAPDVTPQDFHAVAQVYLDGSWHLVDATGMAPADTIAIIGVGADAASAAFLTSFGAMRFVDQSVSVVRV